MSDPMMGGMPQMGGQPPPQNDARQNMEQNRSMLNPADATMMMQEGKFRPDMTVRDFLQESMGVDVDGPVSQLIEASKKQLQNRSAIGKTANMAKGAGRPAFVPPGQNEPGMEPGLDAMMSQMR